MTTLDSGTADGRALRSAIERVWARFLESVRDVAAEAILDVVHAPDAQQYAEQHYETTEAEDVGATEHDCDHDESAAGVVDSDDAERDRDAESAERSRRGKRGGRRHRRRE